MIMMSIMGKLFNGQRKYLFGIIAHLCINTKIVQGLAKSCSHIPIGVSPSTNPGGGEPSRPITCSYRLSNKPQLASNSLIGIRVNPFLSPLPPKLAIPSPSWLLNLCQPGPFEGSLAKLAQVVCIDLLSLFLTM
jgi:hypothetical protein